MLNETKRKEIEIVLFSLQYYYILLHLTSFNANLNNKINKVDIFLYIWLLKSIVQNCSKNKCLIS